MAGAFDTFGFERRLLLKTANAPTNGSVAMSIDKVIDLSHHNATTDFGKAKAAGILGVVHKVTEGGTWSDPRYKQRHESALAAGLLWGAYHFANNRNATVQADHFLATVNLDAKDLLVLDIENTNPQGNEMSIDQAVIFVNRIKKVIGRWPGVYAGSYLRELLPPSGNATLSNCWRWIAQYAAAPVFLPGWTAWTMWQWTDGKDGKHPVAGIGNCDRDKFNGSEQELESLWGARA